MKTILVSLLCGLLCLGAAASESAAPSHLFARKSQAVTRKATSRLGTESDLSVESISPRLALVRGGALSGRIAPRTVALPWSKTGSRANKQNEAKETMDAFLTRDSRNTFIARVYAILSCQMLVTAASVFMFGTNDWASKWLQSSKGFGAVVPGVSLLISTVTWFIMCASTEARRSSPGKWQLLVLFTLGEAISAGFLTSFFKFRSVVSAMLTVGATTSAISLYTYAQRNSKYDLSQLGTTLTQGGLIFLFLGFIQLLEVVGVLPKGFLPLSEKAYCFFGATLFTGYVAYHTKTIVGGKYSHHPMSEKDYVFGAMTLYNDIISLFTYMLRIVGEDKE